LSDVLAFTLNVQNVEKLPSIFSITVSANDNQNYQ
jgi:hypothetical protein